MHYAQEFRKRCEITAETAGLKPLVVDKMALICSRTIKLNRVSFDFQRLSDIPDRYSKAVCDR